MPGPESCHSQPHPSVTVIIPVHNGGTPFVHCLRALCKSTPRPLEMIVAANGCRDRSAEVARMCGARVIEIDRAIGPAAARNAAARQARGDILFFVDADVAIHADAIERLLACFEADPALAACFGSYDAAPPETNFYSQYKNLFHHFIHQQASEKATTFWAGCGAIRKSVFFELGGFDVSYRMPAIEDIELGYRLTARGYAIRLEKRMQASHWKRWQFISVLRADILGRAVPWTRLIMRSRVLPNDLNLKNRYRFSVLLAILLAGFLPAGLFTGLPLWPALAAAFLLIGLNRDWYRFLIQRKGWRWTLPAVAWHWIYYLYCGAAFAYAALSENTNPAAHPNGLS